MKAAVKSLTLQGSSPAQGHIMLSKLYAYKGGNFYPVIKLTISALLYTPIYSLFASISTNLGAFENSSSSSILKTNKFPEYKP